MRRRRGDCGVDVDEDENKNVDEDMYSGG